jgi:hypothetical protein
MTEEEGVTCPSCHKYYKGHTNQYGKVCMVCGFYIEPESEFINEDIKRKNEESTKKARTSLRNRIRQILLGDQNGYTK